MGTCHHCGLEYDAPVRRGGPRKYCTAKCRIAAQTIRHKPYRAEWYRKKLADNPGFYAQQMYGIEKDHYLRLMAQKVCDLCGKDLPKNTKDRCIDHDHATGEIRGVLHRWCNGTLGIYENHKDEFERYLQGFRHDHHPVAAGAGTSPSGV